MGSFFLVYSGRVVSFFCTDLPTILALELHFIFPSKKRTRHISFKAWLECLVYCCNGNTSWEEAIRGWQLRWLSFPNDMHRQVVEVKSWRYELRGFTLDKLAHNWGAPSEAGGIDSDVYPSFGVSNQPYHRSAVFLSSVIPICIYILNGCVCRGKELEKKSPTRQREKTGFIWLGLSRWIL